MDGEKIPNETEQKDEKQEALLRSAYHLAYLAAFRDFSFIATMILFCALLIFLVVVQ